MAAAPSQPTARKSADQRREELVNIAIRHFAVRGYQAASTEQIAREAGLSQPYLFRLFGTKRDLFLACCARVMDRIVETFRQAARGVPQGEQMEAMGKAYIDLLADRTSLLFQMQSYAACADPEIRDYVRARYRDLVHEVGRLSSADPAQLWQFFSHGMLLNVIASLDLAAVAGEDEWAARWSDPEPLILAAVGRAAQA